jgi:hypothetical protein
MLKRALGGKPSFFFLGSSIPKKERSLSFKSSINSLFSSDGIFIFSFGIQFKPKSEPGEDMHAGNGHNSFLSVYDLYEGSHVCLNAQIPPHSQSWGRGPGEGHFVKTILRRLITTKLIF